MGSGGSTPFTFPMPSKLVVTAAAIGGGVLVCVSVSPGPVGEDPKRFGSHFRGRWFPQKTAVDYMLYPGHYARLNNRVPHEAFNDSDTVRVHAIVDFMDEQLARDADGNYIDYRHADPYFDGDAELTYFA